jgi:hypothetical protein
LLLAVALAPAACSHVSAVRVQDETIEVGPGLRPVAAIQANAIRGYFLYIPLGPRADLDRAVNQLLVATAKTMGADKVVLLEFDATPDGGVWALFRKFIGWRSARAKGIAVQVAAPALDPNADEGPEPAPSPPSPPPSPTGSGETSDR